MTTIETRNLVKALLADQKNLSSSVTNALDELVQAETWPIHRSDVCPKCGCDSVATIEYVGGESELVIEDHQGQWFSGSTKFDYNDSRTTTDIHGNVILVCESCDHEWAHDNLETEGGLGNLAK